MPSSRVDVRREADVLRVRFSGPWALAGGVPSVEPIAREIESGPPLSRLVFEAGGLEAWDSALVSAVHSLAGFAAALGVPVDTGGLPEGARRLVRLALAVPPPRVLVPRAEDDALTARVGRIALRAWDTASDALGFLGETLLALVARLRGRARFRRVDLMHAVEATGVGALGIVALINFLIGAVLAFVGAVQLQQFGAALYVANLVGIAVARELGALMTGIVMAGRTGPPSPRCSAP